MKVLVTGAAGYIGSVVVEVVREAGHSVIALDNLARGHRQAVAASVPFLQADLADRDALENIFANHEVGAVMHLAALALVGESVAHPQEYFRNNVVGGMNLLKAMVKHHVPQIVFSSSCAVYGQPDRVPITEDTPKSPLNPYGETKLAFENMLRWYGRAYGLSSISLRYFNAAGASATRGEDHTPESHLIPNVLKVALGQAAHVPVFGTDYATKDGTCVRDYVHVLDIAGAHLTALARFGGGQVCEAYNLGTGKGLSVFEIIGAARRITGHPIPHIVSPGRPGDPATLVAGADSARRELGWTPEYSDLNRIVGSAWDWLQAHPDGYDLPVGGPRHTSLCETVAR